MSELLTFGEVQQAREILAVTGMCATSDDFKSIVNEATRKLVNRGPGERAWYGTVKRLQICTDSNCITWPRFVGTVLAVNTFGSNIPVQNGWFNFMPFNRGDFSGSGFRWVNGSCAGNLTVVNGDDSPVAQNVPCGQNFYVRVFPQTRLDVGKKITIFGIDRYGQVLRTKRSDGVYRDGMEIVVALPFTSSSAPVRRIGRVLKEKTSGDLRTFLYDADNDATHNCSIYGPEETSPSYRQSKIQNMRSVCCDGVTTVQAMVKLQFIPVNYASDMVLIGNIDALKYMIQSIRAGESGNARDAAAYEAASIRELNLELEDKIPVDQSPVQIMSFGTALPRKAGVGMI